jgi:zinc/manganese transport system substrate-binding protein
LLLVITPINVPAMRTFLARLATVMAAVLLASGCGSDDDDGQTSAGVDAPEGAPVVLVTTSIWADVVSNVACDGLASVEAMIPVGGDPHGYEPSLRDRERMGEAAVIVANGLLLEETLEDTIDAVEAEGTPVVHLADFVETIEFAEGADEHADEGEDDEHADEGEDADEGEGDEHADEGEDAEDGDEHADEGHEGGDPHIWFDPLRVQSVLVPLADVLVAEAGLDRTAVDGCVAAYSDELARVDGEVEGLLATIPDGRRTLVTNHEALGYFADRYGFELLGAVIPSPSTLAETNPSELEELASAITDAGVPAIFAESQHSSDDADALAAQIGDVDVVTLFTDSLGEAGSGADTYVGLLRTDAELIAGALGG